jgi:hypothetical protein
VPDRADEGVGSACDRSSRETTKFLKIAAVKRLREHPHPAFGHLLPQAGEGKNSESFIDIQKMKMPELLTPAFSNSATQLTTKVSVATLSLRVS